MRIRNLDELDLEGADGETITVAVTSDDVINYVLNGKTWNGGSFKLDGNVAAVYTLAVNVTYKGKDDSGAATIKVTGSKGGDESVHDETQAQGEAKDAAIYQITIA